MQIALSGFLGMLVGAALMWWVIAGSRRPLRPHLTDPEYGPAVRAAIRHVRIHGTLNLMQLEHLLDINGMTALRYLDQMVHDGILKQQGHRGRGAFYTLA